MLNKAAVPPYYGGDDRLGSPRRSLTSAPPLCSLGSFVRFRINSPKVIHQVFETEVVVVNLESGDYYSIRGSGIAIWRALDQGIEDDQIVAAFGSAAETKSFLDQLQREELIVVDPARAAGPNSAVSETAAGPPTIEKFTDMRDLLLLDPIHELGEGGWPKSQIDPSVEK